MTESKHTPGPWQMDEGNEVHKHGRTIFAWPPLSGASEEEQLANMVLGHAAPDLLEALEMVRDADDDCAADGLPTIPTAARAKIDAAIAKAKGQ